MRAGNYLAEAIFELFSVRVSCVVVVDGRFCGLHIYIYIYAVHSGNIENTCMDLPVRWQISGRNLISRSLLFGRFSTVTKNRITVFLLFSFHSFELLGNTFNLFS